MAGARNDGGVRLFRRVALLRDECGLRIVLLALVFVGLGLACGCGGSSSSGPAQVAAPSNLTYQQTTIMATVGQAVSSDTPTITGAVTSFAASPALPAGLVLNNSTGVISGTPTAVAAQTVYTVTASNAGGSTSASLQITVAAAIAPPSNLTYPQTTIAATVGEAIIPDTPTVNGTVTSYAVSPTLPAGLALSNSTGTISGTPTVVAAQATFTVTASNSAGATSATVQIGVVTAVPPPSNLTYPQLTITATVGLAITADIPLAGGAAASYMVMPALPPGLSLDGSSGTISGTPTAVTAQATYTVTASNAGGSTTASIAIAVNSASTVLLDLGHAASILSLRMEPTRVLSQDYSGHWVLWDYASRTEIESGDQLFPAPNGISDYRWIVDMAGPTVAIGITNGVEIRSSTDGHVEALIVSPMIDSVTQTPGATWWKLASDGSYICAGSKDGLSVWGLAGQLLVSKQGDYSTANAFAAPEQVQVAMGAAGQSVVETISTADGSSTIGPAFQGEFNSWFLDGSRFLTNLETTVWTYSNASSQLAIVSLPTITGLTGQGNWIWTYDAAIGSSLDIYAIGGSSPAATYTPGIDTLAIPSATTIGLLPYGLGGSSVIDLSGATPSKADFTYPVADAANPPTYAATSATEWLVGNTHGVIVNGANVASGTGYFGLGTAWSIAGGTGRAAVATAIGEIVYFDPSSSAPEGAIGFSSSKLAMSSDGSVLAAAANTNDAQYAPDRTLNVFSLPSVNLIATWPYTFNGIPTLFDFSLSGSGETIGQVLGTVGMANFTRQVTAVSGGPILWSDTPTDAADADPIELSPDGTLVAVSNGSPSTTSATKIYKNGQLVTAVPGWVVGWIDNERVLVNNYAVVTRFITYANATLYSATGTNLATVNLPELMSIQTVTSDSVYSPKLNTIFSLTTGAATWTNPNPTTGVGAVAGGYVVYASGSRILADTY